MIGTTTRPSWLLGLGALALGALLWLMALQPAEAEQNADPVQELLQDAARASPSAPTDPARAQLEQLERDKAREHERLMKKEDNKRLFAPIVAAVGLLSLLIVNYLLLSRGNGSSTQVVHVTALVLIIFGTLFVVVVADSDQQLTAAVGILGAVAGYLFGSARAQQETGAGAQRQRDQPVTGQGAQPD